MRVDTANLELKNTGLIKVHDNLSIFDPRLGADAASVLGARISRSRNLNKRAASMFDGIDVEKLYWSHELLTPTEDVAMFLAQNLGDYGHASIADMAHVAFYVHRVPLSICWLLEDYALFKGMETSTRAVAYSPKTPQAVLCNNPSHVDFLKIYADKGSEGGGYKYDKSRYMLPSSIPQGVVVCGSVRDIYSHIKDLRCFEWLDPILDWCCDALKLLAPKTWEELSKKGTRRPLPPFKWRPIPTQPVHGCKIQLSYSDMEAFAKRFDKHDYPIRTSARTYMDTIFNNIHVEVGFNVSWVSARDFHRHRPGGDWLMSIPTQQGKWIAVDIVDDQLRSTTIENEHWQEISSQLTLEWQDLANIPTGTLVRLERRMSLRNLVYMLELRAKTSGRNFEYAVISTQLMKRLIDALQHYANYTGSALDWERYALVDVTREILRTQRLLESYDEMRRLNSEHFEVMGAFTFNDLPSLSEMPYV